MRSIYVHKRVKGLEQILLYLKGEGVGYELFYETKPFLWLCKIAIAGNLGEWNLRRVWDITNENDLRLEYTNNRLQIFI